ncbi:c-type cytochrome [Ideonella sp. YS5]|uniref:c-type cytochrome n=1 Tax=Ideonella sp. YS5 TaxID=3453714 RepID=UPI003EE8DB9E
MSSSPETRRTLRMAVLGLALVTQIAQPAAVAPPSSYPGIGRPATAKELAAWDIDVRPDFKGLPPGSGSVAQGQDIWEAKCASCHGIFGESNQVFNPLVGGTTAEDVKTGHAARLMDPAFPARTTLMKLPTVSTLWDYIHRAMPWNAPKSLKVDEVYAVSAFLLNLGGVVPDDFVLSDRTMAEAQSRLPNRNGMTTAHALWPGRSLPGIATQPDVRAPACMHDCATEAKVSSLLPDHARNAHGNLADQTRAVGPQHGVGTGAPAAADRADTPPAVSLLQGHGCVACHAIDSKLIGPAFVDVAARHGSRSDALVYLSEKIRTGGSGSWGAIPMPPQNLSDADARAIAQWLADGARK